MQLCIFEDSNFKNFLPLVYFRPVYDLRCGIMSLRQKIESVFPRAAVVLHARDELINVIKEEYSGRSMNRLQKEDTWFINGRVIADENLSSLIRSHSGGQKIFLKGDEIAAAYLKSSSLDIILQQWSKPLSKDVFRGDTETFRGMMVCYPWDLVASTASEIEKDFGRFVKKARRGAFGKVYQGAHLIKKSNLYLGKGTIVKPGSVLDAENGPIVLGKNVTVMPNAVIEGPAFIGDHTVIKVGAKIYHGTSIGQHCKVGGEVDCSIIQSYSNKQHDGFLGHSYLGGWINIGADTNTSDLKNTYGTVRVHLNGESIDTGMQFVGLIMGDHSKTGINVMLDTGTIVGVSCNVYGAGLPPKFLPSFSWGEKNSFTLYNLDKSLEIARKVMARRNVQMSESYEELFRSVFILTEKSRRSAGII